MSPSIPYTCTLHMCYWLSYSCFEVKSEYEVVTRATTQVPNADFCSPHFSCHDYMYMCVVHLHAHVYMYYIYIYYYSSLVYSLSEFDWELG